MSLLVGLIVIWLLWKFLKFSLWLLGFLIIVALAGFLIHTFVIPAILLILGGLTYGITSFFR